MEDKPFGAVSETELTVVPDKLLVAQGNAVALAQVSLAGGAGGTAEITEISSIAAAPFGLTHLV